MIVSFASSGSLAFGVAALLFPVYYFLYGPLVPETILLTTVIFL